MSIQQPTYAFDGLPIEAVPAGTNVLVTGPALGGIRQLLLCMLLRQDPREGALFIAADTSGPETLTEYQQLGGDLDFARVGVIDCTEESTEDAARNIHAASSPSDLTGVGIEFSSLYERLVENGARKVRTGIYTLTPFVVYTDPRAVFRFVHTLTGRICAADGLGACAIDPSTVDERSLSSLSQAFDGRIELKARDDGAYIRLTGLGDPDKEWRPLDVDV